MTHRIIFVKNLQRGSILFLAARLILTFTRPCVDCKSRFTVSNDETLRSTAIPAVTIDVLHRLQNTRDSGQVGIRMKASTCGSTGCCSSLPLSLKSTRVLT